MKKELLLAGAALAVGLGAAIWNIAEEAASIAADMDYAMQNPEPEISLPANDTPDISNIEPPFKSMSADWSGTDLAGWWRYDIPEEYKEKGGCLPDIVQVYTYCLCRQHGLDYAMVLAMMEVGSGYRYDARRDDGGIGYLQVVQEYLTGDMGGMSDEAIRNSLCNPYMNIRIALEHLAELADRFIAMDEMLTAYHYGVAGAYRSYFNQNVYHSPYSDKVQETRARILMDLEDRKTEVWYQAVMQQECEPGKSEPDERAKEEQP